MNLTKCFAAGLCLTAMTVSAATVFKANSFETGEAGTGWTFDGTKNWDSSGVRVAGDASLAGYTAARPMTGVTSNTVLKLDTEGSVWTNAITGGSFSGTAVWSDMLVKFVPSEELPVLASADGGKLAIAVKAGAGGTNYLNVASNNGATFSWVEKSQEISTSSWYRVTVKLYDVEGWPYADVLINNTLVCNMLSLDGSLVFNSIGFSGTGFIDEVVVRDDSPFVVQFAGTGAVITDTTAYDNWLTANSLTRASVVSTQYNAYLMGVAKDTTTSPVLVVNSITVGGTTTLTVKAKYANGDLVNLGTLNNGAVLTVWGKEALTDSTWVSLGTNLDFNQPTYKFFKVTTGTNPNP